MRASKLNRAVIFSSVVSLAHAFFYFHYHPGKFEHVNGMNPTVGKPQAATDDFFFCIARLFENAVAYVEILKLCIVQYSHSLIGENLNLVDEGIVQIMMKGLGQSLLILIAAGEVHHVFVQLGLQFHPEMRPSKIRFLRQNTVGMDTRLKKVASC